MKHDHVKPSEPKETPFLWRVKMMKWHYRRHFQLLRGDNELAKYHKRQAEIIKASLGRDKRNFTNTIFQ